MPLDFPASPNVGDRWTGSNGVDYIWDGIKWVAAGIGGGTGAFLPIAGGTMLGPLNLTATGATTARSVQDHFGEVRNVKDFGARGDGTTDDTAAIRAAVAALPPTGGAVYLPSGTYLVTACLYLPSNTRLFGDGPASTLKAGINWTGADLNGNDPALQFVQNVHSQAPAAGAMTWPYTDHDITVDRLRFDYTGINAVNGSTTAIVMIAAQNIRIEECVFECAIIGNATACIACDNTVVRDCRAYDFDNCAYDHWWGPSNGNVIDCFASTAVSAQIINWNPDATNHVTPGLIARGFIIANNTLVGTGADAIPMQLEPLEANVSVVDVQVLGNRLVNVTLVMRGAVIGMVVSNNLFDAPLGGTSAITSTPLFGGNPADLSITGNLILNPATTVGSIAPIVVRCDSAVIANNAVIGAAIQNCLDTGANSPVVIGNYFAGGATNSNNSVAQDGTLRLIDGISFGSTGLVNGQLDLSHGVMLFDGGSTNQTGISASWPGTGNSHLNFITGVNSEHSHMVNGVNIATVNSAGVFASAGMAIGVGGTAGPTWTTGVGVPASLQPNGSLYSREDGVTSSRLYISAGGGTWAAVAGV